MESFSKKDPSSPISVNTVRYLINPMVSWALTHEQQDIITGDIAQTLVTGVFQILCAEGASGSEQMLIEAIQLCSSLVQHAPSSLKEHRKEVIQYIWWTLKQDNMAKPYAFLCVAHFFRAFQRGVQDNVVLKAFINMVRVSPTDSASREAVKQAIDLSVPILAESVDSGAHSPGEPASEADGADINSLGDLPPSLNTPVGRKRATYAALLRRVLAEEGPSSPALVIILQMVVRNREAFFASRWEVEFDIN